jgi:hypothetical protein
LKDDIRRLVRLQEIAFEIRDLEESRGTLPERLAGLEQTFQQRIAEIGSARLRHEALVQQDQRLSRERVDLQERLRQAQQKLMHVNNQREYSAVLNEIDAYKNSLASTEDRMLECETQIEELAGPAAEADERINEERTTVEKQKKDLAEVFSAAGERLVELNKQRSELAALLPTGVLRRFESVFRARAGVALARVEKESCSACHVRLRPQVINLARRGEELVTCDSCRRILVIDENELASEGAGGQTGSGAPPSDGPKAEAGQ